MQENISLIIIVAAFSVILNLFYGAEAFTSRLRNFKDNILLSAAYLALSLWGITQIINYFPTNESLNLWTVRLGYTFVAIAISMIYFFISSTSIYKESNGNKNSQILLTAAIIIILTLSGLFVPSISIKNNQIFANTNLVFASLYMIVVIFITIRLVNKIRSAVKNSSNVSLRTMLILLSWSLIATAFMALIFNFIIPNTLPLSPKSSPLLGFISTLLFSISSRYIFTRNRYSSLKIYLGKFFYYFVVTIISYLTFHLVYIVQTKLWGSIYAIDALISGLILALFFVIMLNNIIGESVTRYLQKTLKLYGNSSQSIRDNFLQSISKVENYEDLCTIIDNFIQINFNNKSNFNLYILGQNKLIQDQDESSIDFSVLSEFLDKNNELFFEESSQISLSELLINPKFKTTTANNIKMLYDSSLEIIQVLKVGKKNLGYLLLYRKIDRMAYSSEELSLIENLASIIGLVISQIQIYKEEKDFNTRLQSTVAEQTYELQVKNKTLEESLRKERDMMDILGHELRTPLSIARNQIGYLELFLKNNPTLTSIERGTVEPYIQKSLENIRREVKILETILSSTKIENNRLQLTQSEIDCNELVKSSVEGMEEIAIAKGLVLKAETPDKPIICNTDKERLQEILFNLIDNAIKYTKEGSVTVKLEQDGDDVIFSVIDTGEGIPPEDIPNLGKKFFRSRMYLGSSGTGVNVVRPGGTGIGLFVVFGLAKLMNGKIEISSEVNKGSTFKLKLPIS